MEQELDKLMPKVLYNPDGDDSDKKLVGGNTTNILNLADISKPVYVNLFKISFSNNWIPDKVSDMSTDKVDYQMRLLDDERVVYDTLLSFLIYMDTIQTNNLPNIAKFVTLSEAVLMYSRQTYDESLHSYSYGYTLSEMMTIEEFNKIIYMWKTNKTLLNRNKYIAKLYEDNVNKNSRRAFLILLIANYLLESVYFYTAFNFFHNLAYRGLMKATNVQIKYIKRDELVHCSFFKNQIHQFKEENPDVWDEKLVLDMFKEAVSYDLNFNLEIIGDKVLGMSKQSIEDYTYFNANKRLNDINCMEIFPDRENPYKHLDMMASIEDEKSNKSNSFEVTSISYKQANAFKGWLKFARKKLIKRIEKETNPEELKLLKLELETLTPKIEKEENSTI